MEQEKEVAAIEIRYTELEDAKFLKQWLQEPGVARWFPMDDQVEIDHAVNYWISLSRYKCSLTAVYKGVPCGIASLYLQPYRKLSHQAEFGIVVGGGYRGKGIGSQLLEALMQMAKDSFHMEMLHLQVYAENPAIRLYRRFGFKEFGRQTHSIKENGVYLGRVFMERFL